MLDQKLRILLIGGGSGGHILPSLAVWRELKAECEKKKQDAEALFICSRGKLDAQILSQEGVAFQSIFTWKIRRYFDIRTFYEVFGFFIGMVQSFFILCRFRPHIIFTKGGFVSLPLCFVAWCMRKKIVAHESDSVAGLANKIVAKMASIVCTGFKISGEKYVYTGNPIHNFRIQKSEKKHSLPTLLIVGGSQGAAFINMAISQLAPQLCEKCYVVHVAGPGKGISFTHKNYRSYELLAVEKLFTLYAEADVVITRGSAGMLTEISSFGLPMIIVPLPGSANNHQWHNAKYFEKHHAGMVLEQKSERYFTKELLTYVQMFIENSEKRKEFGTNAKKLFVPDATKKIVQTLYDYRS